MPSPFSFRTAIVLALCLLSPALHAEDRARARQLFGQATQHYDLGEYREALNDFKEAYRNLEDPTLLYNIGQCHRQLGEKEPAVRFFRTYLSKVPDAPNRDEVLRIIAALDKSIATDRAANAPAPEKPAAAPVAPAATTASAPLEVSRAAPPPRTPIYKKWWLWTVVGVVVVGAAVGAGLAVGLSHTGHTPTAMTDFGTIRF